MLHTCEGSDRRGRISSFRQAHYSSPLVVWGLVAVGAEGGTVVPWVIEGVVSSVYLAYWVPPRYGVALSSKGDGVQLCINDGQCIVAAHFWNSVS